MDFLGIGPLELIFVLLIALIIFGPNDMVKAGKTAGKQLRKIVKSPTWHTLQQASKEMRGLPTKLIREAGIDELEQEINTIRDTTKVEVDGLSKKDISSWVTPVDKDAPQKDEEKPSSESSTTPEKEQS